MANLIKIDPTNWAEMIGTMDDCKANPINYAFPLVGENEDGESVYVEICPDRIRVETTQRNDWIRVNVYWRDGLTEELYDGRLIREKRENAR